MYVYRVVVAYLNFAKMLNKVITESLISLWECLLGFGVRCLEKDIYKFVKK